MTRGDDPAAGSARWHSFFDDQPSSGGAADDALQPISPPRLPAKFKSVSDPERAFHGAPMHMVPRSSGGADAANGEEGSGGVSGGGMARSTSTAELCALGVLEMDSHADETVFGSADDAAAAEGAEMHNGEGVTAVSGVSSAGAAAAGSYDAMRALHSQQQLAAAQQQQQAAAAARGGGLPMGRSTMMRMAGGGGGGLGGGGGGGGDNMPRSRSVTSFHAYEAAGAMQPQQQQQLCRLGGKERERVGGMPLPPQQQQQQQQQGLSAPIPVGRAMKSAAWPLRSVSHATALSELDSQSSGGLSRSLPQSSGALQYYNNQQQQPPHGRNEAFFGEMGGSGDAAPTVSVTGAAAAGAEDGEAEDGGSAGDVVYGFLHQPPQHSSMMRHHPPADSGRSLVYNHSDTDLVASFDRFGLNSNNNNSSSLSGSAASQMRNSSMGSLNFERRSPLSSGDVLMGGPGGALPTPTASPLLSGSTVGVPLEEMGLGSPHLRRDSAAGGGGGNLRQQQQQQQQHFLGGGGGGGGPHSGANSGLGMSRHASYPLLSSAAASGGANNMNNFRRDEQQQQQQQQAYGNASPQHRLGSSGGGGSRGMPGVSGGGVGVSRPPLHHNSGVGGGGGGSAHQSPPRGLDSVLMDDGRYVSASSNSQQQQQQLSNRGGGGANNSNVRSPPEQQGQQNRQVSPQPQSSPRLEGLSGGETNEAAAAAAVLPPGWPQMAALTPQEQVALYNAVVMNQQNQQQGGVDGGGGGSAAGGNLRLPPPQMNPNDPNNPNNSMNMIDLANMLAAAQSPSHRAHVESTAAMLRAHGLPPGAMAEALNRALLAGRVGSGGGGGGGGMGVGGGRGMYEMQHVVQEDPGDGNVYQVQFKRNTRNFLLGKQAMAGHKLPEPGDYVKVEADRGEDMGLVVGRFPLPDGGKPRPATAGHKHRGFAQYEKERIVRLSTDEELHMLNEKKMDEARVLDVCRSKVRQRVLRMQVIDAEFQFDRHKLTFFFEADGRVDFRELVRDLFAIYKTRIWMQQVEPKIPMGYPGHHPHMMGGDASMSQMSPYDDYGPPQPFHHHMAQQQQQQHYGNQRGGGGGGYNAYGGGGGSNARYDDSWQQQHGGHGGAGGGAAMHNPNPAAVSNYPSNGYYGNLSGGGGGLPMRYDSPGVGLPGRGGGGGYNSAAAAAAVNDLYGGGNAMYGNAGGGGGNLYNDGGGYAAIGQGYGAPQPYGAAADMGNVEQMAYDYGMQQQQQLQQQSQQQQRGNSAAAAGSGVEL